MSIFNRNENEVQTQGQSSKGHQLPPDPRKIDASRAAHLERLSHMPGPGVITAGQSQRIQNMAEADVLRQEEKTLEVGAAAEEAGRAAIEAANAADQTIAPDHRLTA